MSSLILYQYEECPYCQKVHRAIDELEIRDKVEMRNTRQEARFRDELRGMTGRTQVPCLVIDGKPMFESDDIVDYLYRQFGQGRERPKRGWLPWS